MLNKLDRLIFVCFLLLVMALPISIAGVEVFASLAGILYVIKRILVVRGKGLFFATVPVEIVLPSLAFFIVCAVSVCFSASPQLGVPALIGKILQGVFLLLAVVDVVTTRKRVLWLFGVFAATAFVVSVDGLWQLWRGVDFIRGNVFDGARVAACMKHPNDLGTFLMFPVIISMGLCSWVWFDGGKDEPSVFSKVGMGAVSLLAFSLVALGLTYSRGAWLGALVAVIVFVMLRKRYFWFGMGLVVVFAFFFTPRMTVARNVSFVSDSVAQSLEPSVDKFTGSDRLNMWKDAVRIIKDYPILGTGLNTYTHVIYKYSQHRKLYPHNSYLQMTAELGFMGVGIFVWLLVSVGKFINQKISLSKNDLIGVLMTGLFAAWVGVLVQSGLDTTFYSVQLSRLLWFVMGLLVAGGLVMGKDGKSC